MGSIWRQSVDAAEHSALTLVNLPRFKSDLLKSNEEIAPQSREILQTFVWWGAGEGRVGHANLQGIITWQKQKLKQISFKVGNFTDFKAFFSGGDDGFSLTVPCQKFKKP